MGDVRSLIDEARRQLDADAARIARALRAVPVDDADGATTELFAAIAGARRHTLAWLRKLFESDADHPAKRPAVTALSALAAAQGAWYRALRGPDPATKRREDRRANELFALAGQVFADLDQTLRTTP
jgi:hypothetical protein